MVQPRPAAARGGGPSCCSRPAEELELYDMRADPWPSQSLHRKADPALLQSFEQRIGTLLACKGAACRS